MGSYSAPTLVNYNEKEVVDNTWSDDTVVLGPFKTQEPYIAIVPTALFNGVINIEALDSSSNWQVVKNITTGATFAIESDSMDIIDRAFSVYLISYPLQVRIRLVTHPTVGAATCYFRYWPSPTNPLF